MCVRLATTVAKAMEKVREDWSRARVERNWERKGRKCIFIFSLFAFFFYFSNSHFSPPFLHCRENDLRSLIYTSPLLMTLLYLSFYYINSPQMDRLRTKAVKCLRKNTFLKMIPCLKPPPLTKLNYIDHFLARPFSLQVRHRLNDSTLNRKKFSVYST